MKRLVVLVGPPGSGKSTLAKEYETEHRYTRISRDDAKHQVKHCVAALNVVKCNKQALKLIEGIYE